MNLMEWPDRALFWITLGATVFVVAVTGDRLQSFTVACLAASAGMNFARLPKRLTPPVEERLDVTINYRDGSKEPSAAYLATEDERGQRVYVVPYAKRRFSEIKSLTVLFLPARSSVRVLMEDDR